MPAEPFDEGVLSGRPSLRAPPAEERGGWGERRSSYSHVRHVLRDLVERRVAVDLVAAGGEHGVLLVGARRGDVGGPDHPDAHALVAPRVQVAGGVHGHLVVRCVQGTDVHVVEPALAADEDLVQRPVPAAERRLRLDGHLRAGGDGAVPALRRQLAHAATPACFSAYAVAASITQALSSLAARRRAIRSAFAGPSPLITRLNSSQSIAPKRCFPVSGSSVSSGSGSVTPRTSACGTDMSTYRWRSSSLLCRLMPHAIDWALLGLSSSGGPNIISDGHHHRSTASCTIARCSSVPRIIVMSSS